MIASFNFKKAGNFANFILAKFIDNSREMFEFFYAFLIFSGSFKPYLKFYGIPVPDLTVLTVAVLLVIVFFSLLKYPKIRLPKRFVPAFVFLVLFYLWMVVSLIYTRSEHYSAVKTLKFLLNIIAFVLPLLVRSFNIKKFVFSYAVLLAVHLLLYFRTVPLLTWGSAFYYSIKTQYLVLSTNVALFNIVLLNVLIARYKARKKLTDLLFLFLTGLVVLNFVIILILGARGPLIFFLFVAFLMVLYHFRAVIVMIAVRFKLLLVAMVFVLVPLLVFKGKAIWNKLITSEGFYRIERLVAWAQPSTDKELDYSAYQRLQFYDFALTGIFSDAKTFFIGRGIGSFGQDYLGEDVRAYPHNFILEIWYETGIIGLLFYLLFLFFVFLPPKKEQVFDNFLLTFIVLNLLKSYSLESARIFYNFYSLSLTEKQE